jgi:hypothetical protein
VRQPPPPDARLGLYRHGDTVSEQTALELVSRPDFVEEWVILPSQGGDSLTLAWGDSCTTAELERVNGWNAAQMAAFRALDVPRGSA